MLVSVLDSGSRFGSTNAHVSLDDAGGDDLGGDGTRGNEYSEESRGACKSPGGGPGGGRHVDSPGGGSHSNGERCGTGDVSGDEGDGVGAPAGDLDDNRMLALVLTALEGFCWL